MKLRLDDTEIAYDAVGTGPALLFLHAFPLSLTMWEPQVEALRATHRVVRLDARGFGGSRPSEGALTMDRLADDAAAVLDALAIRAAVLVGCSMGGYAAFAFARRHGHRLAGLVLQDTRAVADTEPAKVNRAALAARVRTEGVTAAAESLLPNLLGDTSKRERTELVTWVRGQILAARPEAIVSALLGLAAREDSRPTLERIGVPTLVLAGEEDVLAPPAEASSIADAIAGARFEAIPRAGHLANLENPAAVNAALARFLRPQPAAR